MQGNSNHYSNHDINAQIHFKNYNSLERQHDQFFDSMSNTFILRVLSLTQIFPLLSSRMDRPQKASFHNEAQGTSWECIV